MAGKIVADTLEHSTAGSIATNYVVEGSAKAWLSYKGTATNAVLDSLNISSVTDNGTGHYQPNFSSSFNAVDYAAKSIGNNVDAALSANAFDQFTTSNSNVRYYNTSWGVADTKYVVQSIQGDLA